MSLGGDDLDPGGDAARRGTRNVAAMTAGRLAIHAVLVVSAFVIPRALGAESFGRYAAALAVIQILVTSSAAGLPFVEARFLAPLWRRDRAGAIALGSTLWLSRLALAVLAGVAAGLWLALTPQLGLGASVCALAGVLCTTRSANEATRSLFLAVGRVGSLIGLELARVSLTVPAVVLAFAAGGLGGVFAALPLLYALLFALGTAALLRTIGLRPGGFRWASLSPHLGYSLSASVGALAGIFQAQFAVFAVASWVSPREAAYLGFAVQIFALAQGIFIAARRGLTPILSELQAGGETARLASWGKLMLRYWTAALCLMTLAWALLGAFVVELALTPAFLPTHACATWMLAAALFFGWGASANGLLYVLGHARSASIDLVVYAALTTAGLGLVLGGGSEGSALRIAIVYAASSALFAACTLATLWRRGGIRLPLGRPLLLMAPTLLAGPASRWDATLGERAAALALFTVLYLGLAVGLRLLPVSEIRTIASHLRR
jgi:O-antigen/teichoic acid export membrane protein